MSRRRPARSQDKAPEMRLAAEVDSVSKRATPANAHAEEERHARAALTEYFSILREWSLKSQPPDEGFDVLADQS